MSTFIVLDANILIRAVLGNKVQILLKTYQDHIKFYAAEICYYEARKYLPAIFNKHNLPEDLAHEILRDLENLVFPVQEEVYQLYEQEAKARIRFKDINDWPTLALALTLDCPIWTEDKDFLGSGVATWQTAGVELYLMHKHNMIAA